VLVTLVAVGLFAVLVVAVLRSGVQWGGRAGEPHPSSTGSLPGRPFEADSWWNAALPSDAPLYQYADETLDYLRTGPESGRGCVILAGAGNSPWGQPIYQARPSDPSFHVQLSIDLHLPELRDLRIPLNAEAADNNDGSMTIYDRQRGYVVMLTNAKYHSWNDSWTAAGATVTYLDSNGLHVRTGYSDDDRNRGSHRGNNGETAAVSFEEVKSGAIRHVLKVAAGPEVSHQHVYPMVGSDGDYRGSDPAVPPQGLRFRIKPSVDLTKLHLNSEALVIAQALQRYGFYIGDSGGTTALKLEDTVAEGRGQLWRLPADALCGLPFTPEYWDVIEPGYDPGSKEVRTDR
jgi:hypothetical protein